MENFCYLGNIIVKGGTVNSVTAIIRSGWSKFRDLSQLLSSRGLALWGKGRNHSGCLCRALLYVIKIWSNKEVDLIRLEKSDARIVRWMCKITHEDKFLQSSLGTDCYSILFLKNRRLQWFGHLERMKENALSSKCRFEVVVFPEEELGSYGGR